MNCRTFYKHKSLIGFWQQIIIHIRTKVDKPLDMHSGRVNDTSEHAFGTCAYLRWEKYDGTFEIRFVAAKSRVAPLKKLTVPRLELQAALLASRLSKIIQKESRLEFEEIIYFTDSKIVLAWIQSTYRVYKQFVSARVGEIQSNSDLRQWRHIPSESNVADDVSRGIAVEE